ncbi:MAG TPA: hypothetical protein VMU94_07035 [Streptosporangiaceae bacterium]|nr:hypothetical protein [Streptosporangiaceae bacterium]
MSYAINAGFPVLILALIIYVVRGCRLRGIRYGPCMEPGGLPAKVSRRVRARELWYRFRRYVPEPPADGEPLDTGEIRALAQLTLAWESGRTHPDPVMPPRRLEDL